MPAQTVIGADPVVRGTARPRHAASDRGRHEAPTPGTGRHEPAGSAAPFLRRSPTAVAAACTVGAVVALGVLGTVAIGSGSTGDRVAAAATPLSGSVTVAVRSPSATAPVAAEPDQTVVPLGAPVGAEVGGEAGSTATAAAPVSAPRGQDATSGSREAGAPADITQDDPSLGSIGGEHRLGDLTVEIDAIRYLDASGVTGDGSRLVVDLRVHQEGGGPGLTPVAELTCANVRDTGNYYADSTLPGGQELAAGATLTGSIVLGLPASLGSRPCAAPTVRITNPVRPAGDDAAHLAVLEVPVPGGALADA